MEWSIEAFTMTHDLWQIPVNLKTCHDPFLFIQNIFLQHIARGINSGIIIVNVQRESRSWFRHAMLNGIFIDGIPVSLNFLGTWENYS